jgi:hypothetical protein
MEFSHLSPSKCLPPNWHSDLQAKLLVLAEATRNVVVARRSGAGLTS